VEELLHRDHDVTIFHRGRSPNPFGDQVREVLGDRMRAQDVRNAFSGEAFDAVIDLVYVWGPGTAPSQVASVLDAAGNALERYEFLSSCGVYDPQGRLPATEDSPRGPALGQYSADKIATEDFLLEVQREGRASVSIVRPPHVYGPFNNIPRESWFWDRIVARRPVIIPDEGGVLTHIAAVWDVAWALAEALENPGARGEVFNIANAGPVTLSALVDLLAAAAGRSVEKVSVPRARIYDRGGSAFVPPLYVAVSLDFETDLAVDISKAVRTLGFQPTDPLEGLRQTFEWYMKGDRTRKPKFSFDRVLLGR
jgi:nucleoside-diphosphate-sugar epimerase